LSIHVSQISNLIRNHKSFPNKKELSSHIFQMERLKS